MSIQKKSLISTLKTAKKANVASDAKGEKIASMRLVSAKQVSAKVSLKTLKSTSAKSFKSARANFTKAAL